AWAGPVWHGSAQALWPQDGLMRRILEKLTALRGKQRVVLFGVVALAAVCCGVLLASIIQITSTLQEREAAAQEYDGLRQQYAPDAQNSTATASAPQSEAEPEKEPWEINPDYVGWLQIAGAGVDYPVVRGADNTRYLTTTFEGNHNAAGAIFMDSGSIGGFASRHTILYGHNVKNGSMFGSLKKYLDAAYLAQNPTVIVTLPDGTTQTWQIFAARTTDAWDAAYRLDFADAAAFAAFAAALGAPEGTSQILTLSTCTNSEDDNERILVHAALVG
ncbi:class B sortase, partial [Eubacteriales bacterium OttesenSCG-928-N14]|nr:class B sortase [Eubacteriales bacterium OttesenSCG-928-N14]